MFYTVTFYTFVIFQKERRKIKLLIKKINKELKWNLKKRKRKKN